MIMIVDYRKRNYHYNCPLFTFRPTSQGVKYRQFSSKNRIPAVNLAIAKLHCVIPKHFKNGTHHKLDAWTFQT